MDVLIISLLMKMTLLKESSKSRISFIISVIMQLQTVMVSVTKHIMIVMKDIMLTIIQTLHLY